MGMGQFGQRVPAVPQPEDGARGAVARVRRGWDAKGRGALVEQRGKIARS